MKIIFFGRPGSGKGTYASRIAPHLGIVHIATGDMFRAEVATGTPLGKLAEGYMKAGNLVPDDVTINMFKERIAKDDAKKGFILDGYPRNGEQADALDSMTTLSHLLLIHISDEESVHRISLRRVCSSCGMTYHPEWKPPLKEGLCDACGKALMQRDDDKPEARLANGPGQPAHRHAVRHSQTSNLFYID